MTDAKKNFWNKMREYYGAALGEDPWLPPEKPGPAPTTEPERFVPKLVDLDGSPTEVPKSEET